MSDVALRRWSLRALAVLACAYGSGKLVADYWYVGAMFGAVVLVWSPATLKRSAARSLGFFVSSTLIYALVIWAYVRATQQNEGGGTDLWFYVAVALGTVLEPLAHAGWLQVDRKRALMAIPAIYAAWYLGSLVIEPLQDSLGIAKVFVHSASIWQAAYLLGMFGPRPWVTGAARGGPRTSS